MRGRGRVALAAVVALGGCTSVTSSQRQIRATSVDVTALGFDVVTAPMLVGSVTCPSLACVGLACPPSPGPSFLDCFARDAVGAATYDGSGCYTFDTVGVGAWRFFPRNCAANELGYAPVEDRLDFAVIDPAVAVPRLVSVEQLTDPLLLPGEGKAFPSDWAQPEGLPWRLAGPFGMTPALYDHSVYGIEVQVGYRIDLSGLAVEGGGVTAVRHADQRWITVTAAQGQAAELRLEVDGYRWPEPVASVVGVSSAEAASLEVVVGYYEPWLGARPVPVGARAVVRDAQRRLLWGAPVQWSLDEGLLAVGRFEEAALPSPDYLLLSDVCVPPEENVGDHRAVVRATLGDLSATAEVAWTVAELPPWHGDEPFAPSELCVEGEAPPAPVDSGSAPTPDTAGTAPPIGDPPAAGPDPTRLAAGRCGCGGGARGGLLVVGIAAIAARRRKLGPTLTP